MHLNFQVPLNTNPSNNPPILLRNRRGSSIPPRLQSYECFFNWAKHYPLSFNEISHGLLLLEEKFRDESSEIDLLFSKSGRTRNKADRRNSVVGLLASNHFILLLGRKLTQAHFNIEIGKFSQARECLAEAENFLRRWWRWSDDDYEDEKNENSSEGNDDDDDDDGDNNVGGTTVTTSFSSSGGTTFPPEYAQGFMYILQGIKIFLEIQINSEKDGGGGGGRPTGIVASSSKLRTSKVSLDGLKHFKRLGPKAKYIVWTVRDVFFIYCSRSNIERSDWMELILGMEPYIPKWHFYLYRALHGARKLVPRPAPVLLLKEDEGKQERIVTSWSAEGIKERNHPITSRPDIDDNENGGKQSARSNQQHHRRVDPLSISYQAMCITQMFIERRTPPPQHPEDSASSATPSPVNQYPWRFGKTLFENPIQVLSAIQEKTIQVLEMDCHLDGVYLNFSEIHLFLLPYEHRSMELAIRCLKKALRLNNTNPKTHYRMGLANYNMRNHKQAIYHFREAIKNPNNIGAVFGLLQLLMAEPVENSTEIHSVLSYALKNRDLTKVWDKRCLRTLHYLKGCFHFMQQEKDIEEAITSWIIAHDNESPNWSYYFQNLSNQIERFSWPSKRLNLTNVSNALKHVAYLERTQFRQLLLDICSEVDDAIWKDEQEQKNKKKSKERALMFTSDHKKMQSSTVKDKTQDK